MSDALDLLMVAAHPDDVELAAGGLAAKGVRLGYRVGILDLTRGELGSRGTAEIRAREAEASSKVLGIALRENLDLPDGGLTDSIENRNLVIEAIRRHRPSLVAAPHIEDLHPDHAVAGQLAQAAIYPSGFANLTTGSPAWRPQGLIHYMNHYEFTPSFVLDITDDWETRVEAIHCFRSQLYDEELEGTDAPKTNIASADFLVRLESRFRHYGSMIGAEFGEPYWTWRPVPVADPLACFVRGKNQ